MKPIIFNSEEIRAILEKRKTQSRMPIEPQPTWSGRGSQCFTNWKFPKTPAVMLGNEKDLLPFCPWKVGDKFKIELPLRETCYECGYTYKDKKIHNDHRLCSIYKITLEITDIKVERLQDISEEDITSEGIRLPDCVDITFRSFFIHRWNSTHKKYPWENNNWVWVRTFREVSNG